MIATVRSGEPGARLTPEDRRIVRPAALSAGGSHALMERRLNAHVGDAFAEASHRATGGNPLLVEQLAAAVAANGWRPDDDQADLLAGFGPSETEAFALRRFETLGPTAAGVAGAVAVLGSGGSLDVVAALARLDSRECAAAADLLVDAGLLDPERPLTFVHPVLEAAVRNSIPPHRQSLMHREAAQLRPHLRRRARPDRAASSAHRPGRRSRRRRDAPRRGGRRGGSWCARLRRAGARTRARGAAAATGGRRGRPRTRPLPARGRRPGRDRHAA